MKLTLFHQSTKTAVTNKPPMETSKTAPTELIPDQFSINPTVLGHRYWIKGICRLHEDGLCESHISTVFNKNIGLCIDITRGTPLAEAMEREIAKHLADTTYRKYLILNYSFYF